MAEMEGVGQGLSHGIQSFTNTALALGNAEQHALDTREQQKVQQGFKRVGRRGWVQGIDMRPDALLHSEGATQT